MKTKFDFNDGLTIIIGTLFIALIVGTMIYNEPGSKHGYVESTVWGSEFVILPSESHEGDTVRVSGNKAYIYDASDFVQQTGHLAVIR